MMEVMRRAQDPFPTNSRRVLMVAAAASVAAAALLAFTGEGPPGRGRTEASGTFEQTSAEETDSGRGVVRARGGGVVDEDVASTPGLSPTGAPGTDRPGTPGPNSPPPDDLDEVRRAVAAEMHDRLGPAADTPAGEETTDAAVDLVENGDSVEDAVDTVLGPPRP
jgi:hypothetical protein